MEQEITLKQLIMPIIKERKLFIGILASIFMLFVVYYLFAEKLYKTTITIAPNDTDSNAISKFGNIAQFAGIGLGDNSDNSFDLFTYLINKEVILADDKIFSFYKKNKPNNCDARYTQSFFKNKIDITEIKNKNLWTIDIYHPNNIDGVSFANFVIQKTDGYIKSHKEDSIKKRIEYLSSKIETNINQSHRNVLSKLLSDQEQLLMLINSKSFFSLDVAVLPRTGGNYSKPTNKLMLLGFFISFLIAIIFVFVKSFKKAILNEIFTS